MELFFCVFLDHETYSKGVFRAILRSAISCMIIRVITYTYSTKKGYLYNVQVLLLAIV
jgi:hypothetical protein